MSQTTDYVRIHCTGLVGLIADDAFEAHQTRYVTAYYGGDWDRLEPLDGVDLPTRDELTELLNLIADTGGEPYDLGYEDRQYLAEARSYLVDSLNWAVNGDLDAAASSLDAAYTKLRFITYERKRQDKRDYHNPFAAMRPTFERLTKRAAVLNQRLTRMAVTA